MHDSYSVGEQTKQNILSASTSLFYQQGFQATTFDHICQKANVNRALVSYHFKNKRTLGRTVYENIWSKISRTCWQIIHNCTPEMQVCTYLFASYRALLNSHYARFLSELGEDSDHNPKLLQEEKQFFRPIIHKYRTLNEEEFDILAHMNHGIKREIVQIAKQHSEMEYIDHMTSMEIQLLLSYAGYPKEEIQQLIRDSLNFLGNYMIEFKEDFDIDIREIV